MENKNSKLQVFTSEEVKYMANYFLWGGLTLFVALPAILVGPLSLAGWLMLIGLVLLILGK